MREILKEIRVILISIIILAIPFYHYKFIEPPYGWLSSAAFYADAVMVLNLVKFYFKHKDDGGKD
mgnify:CR=1 FL=1